MYTCHVNWMCSFGQCIYDISDIAKLFNVETLIELPELTVELRFEKPIYIG